MGEDKPYPPKKVIDLINVASFTTSTLHLDRSIGWPFGPPNEEAVVSSDSPPDVITLTGKIEMPSSTPDSGVFSTRIKVDDDEMDRIGVYNPSITENWRPEIYASGEERDGSVVWDDHPQLVVGWERRKLAEVVDVSFVEMHPR